MNKKLIVFFIAYIVTKNIANKKSGILNANIKEIEPVSIKTNKDLKINYHNLNIINIIDKNRILDWIKE